LSPPLPSSFASIKLANRGSRGKMAFKMERQKINNEEMHGFDVDSDLTGLSPWRWTKENLEGSN